MSHSSERLSSSRANVCVVAFCGLPASGKTTAAMKLMDFSRWRGIESQVIHVDEYTRGGRGEEYQSEDPGGFDPQYYKVREMGNIHSGEQTQVKNSNEFDWLRNGDQMK